MKFRVLFFCVFILTLLFVLLLKPKDNTRVDPQKVFPSNKTVSTRASSQKQEKKMQVVGFLPYWEVSQKASWRIENLNQLIYFGFSFDKTGGLTTESAEFSSAYFSDLKGKAKERGTKVLLSIEGFDENTTDALLQSEPQTQRLVASIIDIIKQYDLDGVNIDFEYGKDKDLPPFSTFGHFLSVLSQKLKSEGNYVISLDVGALLLVHNKTYPIEKLSSIVDQFIIMAYDYHYPSSERAGPVAPIFAEVNEHSISESVRLYLNVLPNSQLLLGIPLYGYEWETLTTKFKSTAVPKTAALASYKRVNELLHNRSNLNVQFDEISKSPWIVYKDGNVIRQIYFENQKSIEEKIKFVKNNELAGIAIWALGYEGESPDLWEAIAGSLKR